MGAEEFETHYREIFADRWPGLRAALLAPKEKLVFKNPHFDPAAEKPKLPEYVLDPASVRVAQALSVEPGHRVLDTCAAPGGKSLVLSAALAQMGSLTLLELSPKRYANLKHLIHQYFSEDLLSRCRFYCTEAAQWTSRHHEKFDRILCDVPCSGESHLLSHPDELAKWSRSRIKRNSQRQYALLCGAYLSLVPGGRLVYSTCSCLQDENEKVIERFLQKKANTARVLELSELANSERASVGYYFLPDRVGYGPIYVCGLEKPYY